MNDTLFNSSTRTQTCSSLLAVAVWQKGSWVGERFPAADTQHSRPHAEACSGCQCLCVSAAQAPCELRSSSPANGPTVKWPDRVRDSPGSTHRSTRLLSAVGEGTWEGCLHQSWVLVPQSQSFGSGRGLAAAHPPVSVAQEQPPSCSREGAGADCVQGNGKCVTAGALSVPGSLSPPG